MKDVTTGYVAKDEGIISKHFHMIFNVELVTKYLR